MHNNALSITNAAATQIKQIMQKNPEYSLLRVAIQGGGCSGFSYQFNFAHAREKNDALFEHNGAKVIVDPASLPFLQGASLDYKDELIGASFHINNPNATSSCGCGVSFSI